MRLRRDHFDTIVFGPPTLLGVLIVATGFGVLGLVDLVAQRVRGTRGT